MTSRHPNRPPARSLTAWLLSTMANRFLYTSSHSLLRNQLQPLASSTLSHRCRGLNSGAATSSGISDTKAASSRPLTAREREFLERAVSSDDFTPVSAHIPIDTDRIRCPDTCQPGWRTRRKPHLRRPVCCVQVRPTPAALDPPHVGPGSTPSRYIQ